MVDDAIQCRKGCGACCIFISISSPLPNHPYGKKSSETCTNLDLENMTCTLWNTPDFPDICRRFQAVKWICGDNFMEAAKNIQELERLTRKG